MTNLLNQNETLNKIANVLTKAKDDRATIINDVISLVIAEAKDHKELFATKKLAQKWIVENMLNDAKANEVNAYIKRALYVAKAILIDGYKIKKEWLSIAQAEKAVRCDKGAINSFMVHTTEESYIESVKGEIKDRETQKALEYLSDTNAMSLFEDIKAKGGDDARKLLNNMLKAL